MSVVPDPFPFPHLPEPLAERIVERLRRLIVTEEIAPGTPLRERQLAERLGVSRTPLRDALKVLAADGLVRISPNRGATVAALSPQEIDEKLSVLAVLEGFAGEQAAVQASCDQIDRVRNLHDQLIAAFELQDRASYFQFNQAIHLTIVDLAQNATLKTMHDRLNRQLAVYRWQGSADMNLWRTAVAEHETLMKLLEERNGKALSQVLRAHVGSTWRQVRSMHARSGTDDVSGSQIEET